MTTLTKGQLIDIYAEQNEVTKVKAREELEAIFTFFEDVVVEYQAGFQLGKFGKIEVFEKPERAYRNPQTGEMGDPVPAHLDFKVKKSKGAESVSTRLKQA